MSVFKNMYNLGDEEFWRKDMLDDLQLAAELGKTLLERNKELETSLKHHQGIIEDQQQEIEYLTKQTVALREVNDSRLRIYEQLEVSIHELERTNHRLKVDQQADKKNIKTLTQSTTQLETKCEELQTTVDELTKELENAVCKNKRELVATQGRHTSTPQKPRPDDPSHSPLKLLIPPTTCDISSITPSKPQHRTPSEPEHPTDDPLITLLTQQVNDMKNRNETSNRRIHELEQDLSELLQKNNSLQDQVRNVAKEEEMRSVHEELENIDGDSRIYSRCPTCNRRDSISTRDNFSQLDPEEDIEDVDTTSDIGTPARYCSSVSLHIDSSKYAEDNNDYKSNHQNLYRDLEEKYEAFVAVKRQHKPSSQPLSLQEELQLSGDFNNIKNRPQGHGGDFSEAETSSSGFADETSNKATQTDSIRPGSFLCTIADGDDCRFSIYDDASPIDSRFRNRPEYRELFREIFTALKKTADNKEDGKTLPSVDDEDLTTPMVPPVTPLTEPAPNFEPEGDQSVVSSTVSDPESLSLFENTVIENVPKEKIDEEKQVEEEIKTDIKVPKGPVLTPLKREPLEYISVSVNVRKKSSSKKRRSHMNVDRSDSPVIPLSPRINYTAGGRRRGKNSGNATPNTLPPGEPPHVWNGATLQFWASNRSSAASPTPSQCSNKSFTTSTVEFKPSTASHDLHKLKKIDLSYADVLRTPSNKKRDNYGKNYHRK